MMKTIRTKLLLTAMLSLSAAVSFAVPKNRLTLENDFLRRGFSVHNGVLRTVEIENKLAGKKVALKSCSEFALRFSGGTHLTGTDLWLTTDDFKVVAQQQMKDDGLDKWLFQLRNEVHELEVQVEYSLAPDDFYMRKKLRVESQKPRVLERIEVEVLESEEAYPPYTKDSITAHAPGNWSPNIGQPLYTRESATFWGIEFPAARNQVTEGRLRAGYLWGGRLEPGKPYVSYAAVMGVSDDHAYISEAFQDYINRIRVRPLRMQVQYNSWFDYGRGVDKAKFTTSVAKIHEELVTVRGVPPVKMYVIDDGWQDVNASWADKVWKTNAKFDGDFATSRAAVKTADSHLGLWISPGCLFGASRQVGKLRGQGFEAMDNWMSMAGPKYMQALEVRMSELARQGVGFFKMDGVFGHLNLRNFELHGDRYGIPHMPQLELEGIKAGDKALNDPKYDELKLYYLTAGTERLIRIFTQLSTINPDIYLLISNGAYLSPWWLMHVDAVWMINAGDAAGGSSRTKELVYRDGRYHKIFEQENTQFPLNAVFNHEPKKTQTGESKEVFRKYLYMNMSRGTGFIELYIKPFKIMAHDWDVLAEGLLWAETIFPTFTRVRMHGGDPSAGEIYGYTGWNKSGGYVSLHNPGKDTQPYTFTVDRDFGLLPGSGSFAVSSPLEGSLAGFPSKVKPGDVLSCELASGEIRVLNFSVKPLDWTRIKALQERTPEVKPEPIKHAMLGTWSYRNSNRDYSRTFTSDGRCVLLDNGAVNWIRNFRVDSPTRITVDGGLVHELLPDGQLKIESRYTAKKTP